MGAGLAARHPQKQLQRQRPERRLWVSVWLAGRRGIVGTPQSDTAPPLTDFRCLVDPRHAWMNLRRNRIFRQLNEQHLRMAWIYVSTKIDTHQEQAMPFRQIAELCRRRGGSGYRGVRGMDAAAKPTGTYLRRPPQPDPPRHPTDSPLLLLLRLLPLRLPASGRHYRFGGCRAQPGCTTQPLAIHFRIRPVT